MPAAWTASGRCWRSKVRSYEVLRWGRTRHAGRAVGRVVPVHAHGRGRVRAGRAVGGAGGRRDAVPDAAADAAWPAAGAEGPLAADLRRRRAEFGAAVP